MRISVAILFLDACLTLLRLLPNVCLLAVLFLALVVRANGGLGGTVARRLERRGFVAAPFGLALALPVLIFWLCLGLSPSGTGSTAMSFGIDVFLLVFF